jgi:hypothetical protein
VKLNKQVAMHCGIAPPHAIAIAKPSSSNSHQSNGFKIAIRFQSQTRYHRTGTIDDSHYVKLNVLRD